MSDVQEPFVQSLRRSTTFYFLFILSVVTLGPFQFGYHLAELNAPQAVITCKEKAIQSTKIHPSLPECIPMELDQFALISSIFTLGGLVGALLAGPFSNNRGRLPAMRLLTIPSMLGPVLETLATNVPVFAIGRILSGVGAGAALVVVPIYISETSPADQKGLFGAATQIICNVGIVITQVLGMFLSKSNYWRVIPAVPGFIAIYMFLALTLVTESPKWLAEHDQLETARRTLRKIRGKKVDIDDEIRGWNVTRSEHNGTASDPIQAVNPDSSVVEAESLLARNPTASSPSSGSQSLGMLRAVLSPKHRPAIIAVVAVMVTQQFTGINSIVMYSVGLLTALLPTSAALLTVCISILNLVMTTLCAPLPDKIGRKKTLILSTAGMGVSSILLAVGIGSGAKILGGIASLLFVASFAVGLGPVPFILPNEMASAEAVGATQSWALAANWIATFIVGQFFPILNRALGENGSVYYIFAVCALVLGCFIIYYVPETKGRQNADEVWGRRVERDERLE